MQLNPYLSFNGNCGAAFKFYEKNLGGKIDMTMTFGESPMADQVPAAIATRSSMRAWIGDQLLMGSDAPPDRLRADERFFSIAAGQYRGRGGEIFTALSEKGNVSMPIQKLSGLSASARWPINSARPG